MMVYEQLFESFIDDAFGRDKYFEVETVLAKHNFAKCGENERLKEAFEINNEWWGGFWQSENALAILGYNWSQHDKHVNRLIKDVQKAWYG